MFVFLGLEGFIFRKFFKERDFIVNKFTWVIFGICIENVL